VNSEQHLPPTPDDGPYVTLATFCDRVLEEKDGTLTIVRVVDRFTLSVEAVNAHGEAASLEKMPPARLQTTLIVTIKSGQARGTFALTLSIESPQGESRILTKPETIPVRLGGDDQGVNLITQLAIDIQHEGLYWISVNLAGRLLTRVPLRVLYQAPESLPAASVPPQP
jgi:hypothetical protein